MSNNAVTNKLINVALVSAGIYILYKILQKVTAPVIDPLAQGIANTYSWLTLPGDVVVTGNINLPDGSQVPIANIFIDDSMQFVYNGRTYTVTGRDANGNYNAR
jgi:hypothetical protein